MFFSRPIQWYHSHADPIWPDGTFKSNANRQDVKIIKNIKKNDCLKMPK